MLPSVFFPIRNAVPIELEVPVESPYVDAVRIPVVVLEGVVVDDVNHGAHYRRPVVCDALQKRFQPACGGKKINLGLGLLNLDLYLGLMTLDLTQ